MAGLNESLVAHKEPTASLGTIRTLKLPCRTVALSSEFAMTRAPYTATNVPLASARSGWRFGDSPACSRKLSIVVSSMVSNEVIHFEIAFSSTDKSTSIWFAQD